MFRLLFLLAPLILGIALITPSRAVESQPDMQDLQSLIAALASEDTDTSLAAREVLEKLGKDALPVLIEGLKHEERGVRYSCADILGRIGAPAREAVPVLIELLVDESSGIRGEAACAISKIDPTAKDAVPLIIKLLIDGEGEYDRYDAAIALGNFSQDPVILNALITALDDESSWVRDGVIGVLGEREETQPDIVPLIINSLQNDKENRVRGQAAYVLRNFPNHKDTIPALVEALRNHDQWMVIEPVIHSLKEIGPQVVPTLIQSAKDANPWVRAHTAVILTGFLNQPSVVDTLAVLLNDKWWDVRWATAYALNKGGKNRPGKDIIPHLINTLGDDNSGDRFRNPYGLRWEGEGCEVCSGVEPSFDPRKDVPWCASIALRSFGEQAIPFLLDALKNKNPTIRGNAAYCLGQSYIQSEAIRPALESILSDRDSMVQVKAAGALVYRGLQTAETVSLFLKGYKQGIFNGSEVYNAPWEINDENGSITKLLINALDDESEYVRSLAIELLYRVGEKAVDAVPKLIDLLAAKEPYLKSMAISVLGKIGEPAKEAIPSLLQMVSNPDPYISKAAKSAICKIDPEYEKTPFLATEMLSAILRDSRASESKKCMMERIKALGEDAAQAIPELITSLGDQNPWVRKAAVEALGIIGPMARDALPNLIEMGNDKSEIVRGVVIQSILRISVDFEKIIPVIQQAVNSDDFFIRKSALEALRNYGPGSPDIVPFLFDAYNKSLASIPSRFQDEGIESVGKYIELLQGYDEAKEYEIKVVSVLIAEAIAKIGPSAAETIPMLVEMLSFKDLDKTKKIEDAIACMGSMAVPYLLPILKSEDSWRKYRAKEILGIIGTDAVAPLLNMLQNESDLTVYREVASTLAKIGPPAEEAIPELLTRFKDPDCPVHGPAVTALIAIGKATVPHMAPLLQDENIDIRQRAAFILAKIGADAVDAIPELIQALDDGDQCVRLCVIEALGKIGRDAITAVPRLKNIAENDPADPVRTEAGKALALIIPKETG